MAGLYTIVTAALLCVYGGKRKWGLGLTLAMLALGWLLLWYHATSTLQINW